MPRAKIDEDKLQQIIASLETGQRTIHDLSKLTGMHKRTVYRYIKIAERRGFQIVRGLEKISHYRIIVNQNATQ